MVVAREDAALARSRLWGCAAESRPALLKCPLFVQSAQLERPLRLRTSFWDAHCARNLRFLSAVAPATCDSGVHLFLCEDVFENSDDDVIDVESTIRIAFVAPQEGKRLLPRVGIGGTVELDKALFG